ncbi:MAG: Panacea domain-containing protein [Actinomycetota bacterium]
MGIPPTYNERKLAELMLYVADRLRDDRAGGATKLNKVLYFADFAHMRRTGRPITGAEYQKLPQGPAPRRLLPVRDAMLRGGDAEIVQSSFLGYEQHRLVPIRAADVSVFTADELATVEAVLDDLRNLTATQVSELSHAEPGWKIVDDGETIPYEAAFIAPAHIDTDVALDLTRAVAARYDLPVA